MEHREGTSLVLLHGALGSAEQLAPVADGLANYFDVHVVDLPGHGEAPLLDQPFSLTAFVTSVKNYLEQQQIRQPWIFGHSMGGFVGLLLALEQDCPLSGVITLGTKLGWTPEVASSEVSRLDPEKIEEKVPAFARALEQRHRALDWKVLLQHTRTLTLGLGDQTPLSMERLAEIHVPVFFGVAERDHLVPYEEAQRVVGHLPQGELWTMPGAHPLESVEVEPLTLQLRKLIGETGI